MTNFVEIEKVEGALRHMEAGIEFFFERKDPIVVYSVAWTAYGVLSDLCYARGIKRELEDSELFDELERHRKKEILDAFKRPRNFFQHGERGKAMIKFYPGNAPLMLMMANTLYVRLTGKVSWTAQVLILWFSAKHAERTPLIAKLIDALPHSIDHEDFGLFLSLIRAGERG